MDQCGSAAVRLPEPGGKDLAIQVLAGAKTVSDLAARHEVSRKFVYARTHKARAALEDAFLAEAPDNAVQFNLAVTKTWLRQVIVALSLVCHSSYRGAIEFLRDLLGVSISVGAVHDMLQSVARQAGVINGGENLPGIRVGLHDEIFQDSTPVLAGVDAVWTHCYLLVAEQHRDADTRGVHLLDATRRGLEPDHTIADAGQGLRAGQKAAWGDGRPCHGDVFHILSQCAGLANALARLAKGAATRREKLQTRIDRSGGDPDGELIAGLALARREEVRAYWLARDIRILTQWLNHDVLALAGPVVTLYLNLQRKFNDKSMGHEF